ncbi:hypothetical protein [Polyangium spumosum]|uniref:Uncharacterized protein n=1 Tax=Polyangium spumosum TaxID=889282 RepID=A0A6N7PUU0_9BACT|nr:hypothetical protein [Polyangium spumosum]MRG96002.1 hypothetical protein [Polyangium spumosum]
MSDLKLRYETFYRCILMKFHERRVTRHQRVLALAKGKASLSADDLRIIEKHTPGLRVIKLLAFIAVFLMREEDPLTLAADLESKIDERFEARLRRDGL